MSQDENAAPTIASDTPASDTPASDTPASDTPASDTPASRKHRNRSRRVDGVLAELLAPPVDQEDVSEELILKHAPIRPTSMKGLHGKKHAAIAIREAGQYCKWIRNPTGLARHLSQTLRYLQDQYKNGDTTIEEAVSSSEALIRATKSVLNHARRDVELHKDRLDAALEFLGRREEEIKRRRVELEGLGGYQKLLSEVQTQLQRAAKLRGVIEGIPRSIESRLLRLSGLEELLVLEKQSLTQDLPVFTNLPGSVERILTR